MMALRLARFGLDGTGLTFADSSEGVYMVVVPLPYPLAGFFATAHYLPVLNQTKSGSSS